MTMTERPPADSPAAYVVVVFDLGNVLIKWDPVEAIAQDVGVERARRFVNDPDFDFGGWNLLQDSGRSWEDAEAAAIASHPHYRDEILAYRNHFQHSIKEPVTGTEQILRELHEAGVPLVALTNWSAGMFPAALDRFDFLDLFEDIVVSGEEGVAKPDPAIFAILADRIRHLGSLDDALFIDDSLPNVQAAIAAGMDAIPFTTAAELRADLHARGLPIKEA